MIAAARQRGLPVDGHAPGLSGGQPPPTQQPASAPITSARRWPKPRTSARRHGDPDPRGLRRPQHETLHPLISRYPGRIMLYLDDYHPDDLAGGHIDRLVAGPSPTAMTCLPCWKRPA